MSIEPYANKTYRKKDTPSDDGWTVTGQIASPATGAMELTLVRPQRPDGLSDLRIVAEDLFPIQYEEHPVP
jgi:hypothetical protein